MTVVLARVVTVLSGVSAVWSLCKKCEFVVLDMQGYQKVQILEDVVLDRPLRDCLCVCVFPS